MVELSLDLHAVRNFMVAAYRSEMKTPEYVYIMPWLAHQHDHYPWEANNIQKSEVRSAFDQTIVITAHGYDKQFIDEFQEKFAKLTGIVSSHVGLFCIAQTVFSMLPWLT